MPEAVNSFDDPRLDDYRNISDAQLLRERNLFVAEGRFVVRRLLESGRFPVRSVMATPTARQAIADLLEAQPATPVYEVSPETMSGVTGFNFHRGCLAVGVRGEDLAADAVTETARRLVALEGIADADNVGSIFRSAAAFAADGILLDHTTTDPLYRKALRTSMGAALQVPFARADDWLITLRRCRQSGMLLIALAPEAGATKLSDLTASLRGRPAMLILGSEAGGITAGTFTECDVRARIPMHQDVDSLNVAVAAAIALYELYGTDR